jgi:hypothetical protein
MSPAKAGAIELDEPHWNRRFEEECARYPRLPRYLQEDSAFETVLSEWRRFHFTWTEDGKRKPASSIQGQIGLAVLGIFPPRFIHKDVPRTQDQGFQHDDHMWVRIAGEEWRIVTCEDRTLVLEKGFEAKPEQRSIDLNKAKWGGYCDAAAAMLEAMR